MTAHINIGSNLGNSRLIIEAAVAELCRLSDTGTCRRSDFIESEPWGFSSPHPFVNLGIDIESTRPPLELLDRMQSIEKEVAARFATATNPHNLHRNPDGTYRDRLLDLDLIFYGDTVMDTPRLTLPHPHAKERPFVLIPLSQLGHTLPPC